MGDAISISERRYRRRILGWGAFVFVLIFAVGAAIFLRVVEGDLEGRVADELDSAGLEGIDVSFSGQDGSLECDRPLASPGDVSRLVASVDGVRRVEFAPSCLGVFDVSAADSIVGTRDDSAPAGSTSITTGDTQPDDEQPDDAQPDDAQPDDSTVPTTSGRESILDVLDGDPLFSTLATLISDAGLDEPDDVLALTGSGPFTMLAPTDDAFDAAFDEVGADAFQSLIDDPTRLRTLLLHHVTRGDVESDEFGLDVLDMLDGTTVEVDTDPASGGVRFTSHESVALVDDPITQLDIRTSNGVVHAIDRLLLPEGFELGPEQQPALLSAVLAGDTVVLDGVVATEEQRNTLAVAASLVDATELTDGLTVDPEFAADDDDIDRFGRAIGALNSLTSGEVGLVDGDVTVTGVAEDSFAAAVLTDFGEENDVAVVVDLATSPDSDDLQDELNELVQEDPVEFESGSAELTPGSSEVLAAVAERILLEDDVEIQVIGHTDSAGSASSNLGLSQERADAVRFDLVVLGVDPDSITALGVGGSDPIIVDGDEDSDASRRVEFLVNPL